jgi:hypothetical protein
MKHEPRNYFKKEGHRPIIPIKFGGTWTILFFLIVIETTRITWFYIDWKNMDCKVLSRPNRHELVGPFRPGKTKTTWFSTGPWSAEIHEPVGFLGPAGNGKWTWWFYAGCSSRMNELTVLLSGGRRPEPRCFQSQKDINYVVLSGPEGMNPWVFRNRSKFTVLFTYVRRNEPSSHIQSGRKWTIYD